MRRVLAVLLAVAGGASAAPADYARQWPVVTTAPAPAYSVELAPDVYATVQDASLRDLDVLDADGNRVPVELVAAPAGHATRRTALPWYRLPVPGEGVDTDWRVIAEVDADGRLRGLRSAAIDASRPVTTLLIDAATLTRRPLALELTWASGPDFDAGYRAEGSVDFDRWYPLGGGRLVDVHEAGRRFQRRRIDLSMDGTAPRFLRLVPDDPRQPLPALVRVEALWNATPPPAPHWRVLAPRAIGDGSVEFRLDGRFPVRWLDLETDGNDVATWRLQSRDRPEARWVDRVPHWVVYRMGDGRSRARVLERPVRDRFWRLVPQARGGRPRLRLGYEPERLVFVAAGRPP